MTNDTENADIRLLDFGLSKIINPTEKCTEPYGTLSYVAPEVLTEKPYDQREQEVSQILNIIDKKFYNMNLI